MQLGKTNQLTNREIKPKKNSYIYRSMAITDPVTRQGLRSTTCTASGVFLGQNSLTEPNSLQACF